MENVEREVVTFATSVDAGVVVRPGQIIEIADPVRSGERRGGRIVSATTNSVTVDDATGLSIQGASTLSTVLPDGTVEQVTVSGITNNVFSLGQHFSAAPNSNSVWIFETSTILTTTWRVLEVQEQDRTNYVITASEYNSGKYNHIENGIALPVRDVTNLDIPPEAPSFLLSNVYSAKINFFSASPVLDKSESWKSLKKDTPHISG